MNKMEFLIYWMTETANKESSVIECEEGSARFVSLGHVYGYASRIKRALHDDLYFMHLMQSVDPDNVTKWK